MYQSGSAKAAPHSLYGGSEMGRTQYASVPRSAGECRTAHPRQSMRGTITRPSAQRDGTSRRVRLAMNAHGWCGDRSIDAAARDPASANMIPMEGKTKVSHTQP